MFVDFSNEIAIDFFKHLYAYKIFEKYHGNFVCSIFKRKTRVFCLKKNCLTSSKFVISEAPLNMGKNELVFLFFVIQLEIICANMRILRQDKKRNIYKMSCALLILQATGATSAHWGNKSGHGHLVSNF